MFPELVHLNSILGQPKLRRLTIWAFRKWILDNYEMVSKIDSVPTFGHFRITLKAFRTMVDSPFRECSFRHSRIAELPLRKCPFYKSAKAVSTIRWYPFGIREWPNSRCANALSCIRKWPNRHYADVLSGILEWEKKNYANACFCISERQNRFFVNALIGIPRVPHSVNARSCAA
jgi:hypothetical protein